MSGQQVKPITFGGMRGRDGSQTSVGVLPEHGGIPLDRFREAVNVDFYRTAFARKRPGSTALNLGFASGGPFASGIKALGVTRSPATGFERLWAVDGSGQVAWADAIGSNQWTEETWIDTPGVGTEYEIQTVQFDDAVYFSGAGFGNRLNVYDGTSIRRALMGTPSAPTVANTGAGAYAATLRYYKVRMAVLSGSNVLRMGEASASQSFTPSGGGTAARVTKPSTIESATHWRVEVSLDNAVYYVLSAWIAVGTTTYDDSAATTTYSSNDASPLVGEFLPWDDIDFVVAGEGRLLGLSRFPGRFFFSAAVGTTSASFLDHERVPQSAAAGGRNNYIDLEDDQPSLYAATGLAWWNNSAWIFQSRAIHQYVPTGLPDAPFRRARSYTGAGYGTRAHRTIVKAVDEFGQPALYWLSDIGPCRMTVSGMQFLYRDIEDVVKTLYIADEAGGPTPLDHAVWVPSVKQVRFWSSTQAAGAIDTEMVFDVTKGRLENGEIRGGWSIFTGSPASTITAVAASATLDGRVAPTVAYMGLSSGTTILREDTTATQDDGVSFQAYVDIPERPYAGMTRRVAVTGAEVACVGGSNVDLRLTISRDQGADSRNCDVSIASGEVRKKFADAEMGDADTLKYRIGDAAAQTDAWTIDALTVVHEAREQRVP